MVATSSVADVAPVSNRYKWTALSNTTLGAFMATLDSSIVIISLPAIFRGIGLDPLQPSNISYLLWMLMGYLVCTAVLVVTFGRLGDIYGRVRMYNAGFAVFTAASIALSLTPGHGSSAAMYLIIMRVVQGIGGAMLLANSTAIITDAFPLKERGRAMGINAIAAIAGSFVGLILGGVLADWNWRLVFWVNVPFGIFGTVWAYLKLRELGTRKAAHIDWLGNITFAVGLVALLTGITYGIQPYGGHNMGWTSPFVMACIVVGVGLLVAFCVIEMSVPDPMFNLRLFRIRAFTAGNAAGLFASVGRGGLQFMLIIWLQGIWLPLHGYRFEATPLWAGIFMIPLTVGLLVSAPIAGQLSDRYGARGFATGGMLLAAATFLGLMLLPANFNYLAFATLIFLNGVGMGVFVPPNTTAIMNSVPSDQRGAASGMRATFQNTGMVLSIGIFFSLMIVGLAASLPTTMHDRLVAAGVQPETAVQVAHEPPVGSLFAAFLGYNPMQTLLGPHGLDGVAPDKAAQITGKTFFPDLISEPFIEGLRIAFTFSLILFLLAAWASWKRGPMTQQEQEDDAAVTEALEEAVLA
jgi:EmrB/QacA subfamily drug resistance transporter